MKVKEVIKQLKQYNQEAEVNVITDDMSHKFSLCFGSSEGVTKETAENVSFYVDKLNREEDK